MPETQNSDKEHQRQQMSRLASGWIKLSKLTLEEYAKASGATRSNLFSQVANPDSGKRMSVDALGYSASIAGVRIDADGTWWISDNRAQTWRWENMKETDKEAVVRLVQVLKEECGSPMPFRITRLPLVENDLFRMKREHAMVEIEDRKGNELSAVLVADCSEDLDDAISTFLGTGHFEEQPPRQITPEFAMQVVNGAAPKPREQPDFTTYDWPAWMTIISVLQSRGVSPQDIAKAHQIELPTPKFAPPAPALPVQPFKVDPSAPPESWNF
jgi:hypothetical protein